MALKNSALGVNLYLTQAVWAFNADFTYTLWFVSDSGSQVGTIFEITDVANTKQMTFRIYNTTLELSGWGGTNYISKTIVTGTRYFISLTGQGTALRLVLNADFAGATTATATRPTGNWAAGECMMFGDDFSEYLNGRIRDFRYYNRKLSDNEIETLYRSNSKDDIYSGLKNRFLFNEKAPGETLTAFSNVKNYADKAVTVTGYGTSTDLVFASSFPESKIVN